MTPPSLATYIETVRASVEVLPDLDDAAELPLHRACGGMRPPLLGEPKGDSHRALHLAREFLKFPARGADPR